MLLRWLLYLLIISTIVYEIFKKNSWLPNTGITSSYLHYVYYVCESVMDFLPHLIDESCTRLHQVTELYNPALPHSCVVSHLKWCSFVEYCVQYLCTEHATNLQKGKTTLPWYSLPRHKFHKKNEYNSFSSRSVSRYIPCCFRSTCKEWHEISGWRFQTHETSKLRWCHTVSK